MATIDQRAPLSKRILIIVGCLLIIGGIGAGVIALLRTIAPQNGNSEKNDTSAIQAPAEVISAFRTPGAIKALETAYQEQSAQQSEARVIYTADGRKYALSIPTKYSALFFAKNAAQPNDTAVVQEQLTAFITPKGYEKTANTGQAVSENPAYSTYKSPIGVCQLTSSQPASGAGSPYHSLACVDSTAITQEYSTTEMLLTLYKNSGELPPFTMASRSNVSEGNKMLSIVNLNGEDNTSLLFAAIDGNWEYIGNLGDTNEAESNGKYAISAEMRSKINDARYGNFLKRNIQ